MKLCSAFSLSALFFFLPSLDYSIATLENFSSKPLFFFLCFPPHSWYHSPDYSIATFENFSSKPLFFFLANTPLFSFPSFPLLQASTCSTAPIQQRCHHLQPPPWQVGDVSFSTCPMQPLTLGSHPPLQEMKCSPGLI